MVKGVPWMDDGSIVLRAQHGTHFRVHKSVLARNAEVFADMFEMPQPDESSDDQDVVEGCVVVEVADDSVELSHFLRAMYDGWRCVLCSVLVLALAELAT